MKKFIALLLALVMVAGVFAGCGSNATADTTPPANNAEKPNDNQQNEAPVEEVTELEEYEIIWYIPAGQPDAEAEKAVEAAIYDYLKDTLNVKVDLVYCGFGDYEEKVRMATAAGDKYDLCYTAGWLNNFYTNVSKNAFVPLNDLLDQYGKELYASMPEDGWKAPTVDGNIYAVPNQQIWAGTTSVVCVTSVLDKYGFDLSTVETLKDLEPLMDAMKADDPNCYPMYNGTAGIWGHVVQELGYEFIAGNDLPVAVRLDDYENHEVVNPYEQPEFIEFFKLMREWNQKGYFRPDCATADTSADMGVLVKMQLNSNYIPDMEVGFAQTYGEPVTCAPINDSWLTTGGINAALTAISRTSENPERVMMFLNQMNTDPVLANLVYMGIEGEHYNVVDGYGIPVENSTYNPNADWIFGNSFIALPREGQSKTVHTETLAVNMGAKGSACLGFVFDSSAVANELAGMTAVVEEFLPSLWSGSVDVEETLAALNEKMDAAGADVVREELQRQIDAWVAG